MRFRILLLALLAAGTGCQVFRPVQVNTRHYAFPLPSSAAPAATATRLGLLPTDVSGHLRTRTLVLRGPDGALSYRAQERWAEPLDTAFTRLLAAELSRDPLLDAVLLPERLGEGMDVLLATELMALEGDLESIRGAVRWRLAASDGRLLAAEAVELAAPRTGGDERLGADLIAVGAELARRVRLGVTVALGLED